MPDILIVDDDEQVRAALARALRGQGYAVATANNGKEALDSLDREDELPKIIIIDLLMPVVNGWSLRQSLLGRPSWAKILVIVLSGSGCDESGGALPAVQYLPKPVRLRELFDLVSGLISGQRLPN